MAGLDRMQILARLRAAMARKELSPPEVGAMSYMLSKQQFLK